MRQPVLDKLDEWARRQPDKLLYAFLDIEGRVTESYTYAAFVARTSDIAAHIQGKFPMAPGERVLLAYPPGVEMICAFFACVRLGLIPVPVYPPTSHGFEAARDKTDFIARDSGAAAILTTRSYYWSMKLNEARSSLATRSLARPHVSKLKWIVSTDAKQGTGVHIREAHSDVLFLQYTSGSTSNPKGVMVSHDNVIANCEAMIDHVPVGVSWLPQYHDMGLIGYYIFIALKGGTTYGFSPTDFIQRPALWLETISKYRATASSAPNFAFEYCLRPDKVPAETLAQLDLSSLRVLMNAAEPVRAGTCRDFVQRFEPCGLSPESFFAAYGLAEYTLAVSSRGRTIGTFDRAALRQHRVRPANPDEGETTTLVSCGTPVGTTEIRIVDVTAAPRPAGESEVGEIWIRGPSRCLGYWRRAELSAATFNATLCDDAQPGTGWLRSGDLGFLRNGELFVCGRQKDMLIVRGLNYYPQDIEACVEEESSVRRGCVAAFATQADGVEELVVVAEVRGADHLPDTHALNRRLQQSIGIGAASYVFVQARTIPKTSSGKIVRHLVRDRWFAGDLNVVKQVDVCVNAEPSGNDRADVLRRRFGLSGTETWSLAEAGLDSVRLVEFSMLLKAQLESQGEQELAEAVDLRVLEKIAICELFDVLDQLKTSAPVARLRLKRALSELGREHRAADAELMRQDARLGFDPSLLTASPFREEGSVLLTGGTGFFGPFLLASLLEQTTGDIHVLLRGNEADAMERIRQGLSAVCGNGGTCVTGWEDRVRPVSGDLSQPNLGLSSSAWSNLAGNVHTIYHNGAQVNYLLDYHALRSANVGGTNEVVRLAMSDRAKIVNHISTTFVFGWSVRRSLSETDTNAEMGRLDFGYSQSKWVSEQVVRDAMQHGLAARIFRPALLAPSVSGGGTSFDIAIRLLAFMIKHGIGTSSQNEVSFSPADVAAHNIVAVSRLPESAGSTFHVTRDEYASMSDITAILGEMTGQSFRMYDLQAFVPEIIERCHPGDILYPLLEFLVRSADNISAMEFKRYDNTTFRHFRDQSPAGRADPPLCDVVHGIFRFLQKHGLVNT